MAGWAVAAGLAGLFAAGVFAQAAAQTPEPPRATQPDRAAIAAREQELAGLRGEITGLERRLQAARRQQSGLRGDVARLDLELTLQEKRLAEAVAARDLTARRAAAGAAEVARLENLLAATRRDLSRRVAGLYRMGRQGYVRLLLSLRPDERLLPSIRLVRFLARRDRQAADQYGAARARLARERDQLLARRGELEGWITREEARRRHFAVLRERQAGLLARLEREGAALTARAGELAERERKLSGLLEMLGRGSGEPAAPPGEANQAIQQFRGALDWPARGKVTAGFGPRLDPRYRTQVPHNGLDIATAAGSEVQAVFPGKVLFAAPFAGYGTTVVVHHPGRVFTLYAGLSQLRVGQGDVVSLGDVVGLSSDALYFEIRVENRPENPLHWLR
ncbi:MAG TPA: peptidoglycan DD-metalloendopeptidase family protein [Thermoanaerobaculia bacterium]|nr:peptidoglycan DD-metalloendopeptidase family protein [Thermoanaerobaculia bacterium]